MAQVCDMCGKSPKFGKSVSRSHVRTNRRWTPNIQTVRALRNAATKRLRVCTSCIRPVDAETQPPGTGGGQ